MKSEREIEMLIRRINQEIKRIRPSIKSMGSPEARTVEGLEGKIEAFEEVLENDKKDQVDIGISSVHHGTHTNAAPDEYIITSK